MYPFIDVGHGGSVAGTIAAADKIAAMIDAETKVIPAHGPLSGREGVLAYRNMLAAVRDRIAKLIQEGKTIEQVLAAKPTADFDKTMAPDIPRRAAPGRSRAPRTRRRAFKPLLPTDSL
jgi:glyoxylase-like metal-dependent hydrolase (beta-lactamase superfamily II)